MCPEQKKITGRMKKLRRQLQGEGNLPALNLILEIEKMTRDEFERQKRANEFSQHMSKVRATKEQRHVVAVEAKEANVRMTYRPDTGEIMVKLPKGTPIRKIMMLESLCDKIKRDLPDTVPVTLRGTAHWSETTKSFRVLLQSNSKGFKHSFTN